MRAPLKTRCGDLGSLVKYYHYYYYYYYYYYRVIVLFFQPIRFKVILLKSLYVLYVDAPMCER